MTHLAPPGDLLDEAAGSASLSDELTRLVRVLHAVKNSATAGTGTDARERAAHVLLFPIARLGPLRQGALSELVHADPSTVSRHVTLLVERGLVRRVADAADGRVIRLVITEAGEASLERLRQERDTLLEQVTADWSATEIADFTGLLHRFVQDLTDHLPSVGATAGGAPTTCAESER